MLSNYAAATRAAAYELLVHERTVRDSSRRVKVLGFACLGLAFLGTASTVVARQDVPAHEKAAEGKHLSDRDDLVQSFHEDLDISAVVQFVSH